MDLSIIIPTKDRAEVVRDTLISILKILQGNSNYEAIVVNDSKTTRVPFESQGNLTVVANPKSGVASARNFGVSLAKSDNLLFIDDDLLIQAEHAHRAISFLKEQPNDCLNIDWIYPPDLMKKLDSIKFGRFMKRNELVSLKGWSRGVAYYSDALFERTTMASQFLVIRRSVFEKVGKYNESFPHAGFEDYDFQERLKKSNVKLMIDTRYTAYHNEKDRLIPLNWLKRKEREGETRAVAVKKFNYSEKDPGYSIIKKGIYSLLVPFRILFYYGSVCIPNLRMFDFIYNRLMHLLAGMYHYAGYIKVRSK